MTDSDLIKVGEFIHNELRSRRVEWDFDLCGACALASLLMSDVIWRLWGVRTEIVLGYYGDNPHAWVQHGNQVIDITATQFGVTEKVLLSKFTCSRYRAVHFDDATTDVPRYRMNSARSKAPFAPRGEELPGWCWGYKESIRALYRDTRRCALEYMKQQEAA